MIKVNRMRTYQSLALLWKQCLLCKLPGRILGIILRSTEHTNKDLWLIWIPFSLPKISFALHLFQYKFFSSSNVKIILNTTSTVRYFQNLQVNSDVLFVSKYVNIYTVLWKQEDEMKRYVLYPGNITIYYGICYLLFFSN